MHMLRLQPSASPSGFDLSLQPCASPLGLDLSLQPCASPLGLDLSLQPCASPLGLDLSLQSCASSLDYLVILIHDRFSTSLFNQCLGLRGLDRTLSTTYLIIYI